MCSKALFLRKKSTGLNSIEELAYSLASRISGLKVITLPEHGNPGKESFEILGSPKTPRRYQSHFFT